MRPGADTLRARVGDVAFSMVCEPGLACGVTAVMSCILSGF